MRLITALCAGHPKLNWPHCRQLLNFRVGRGVPERVGRRGDLSLQRDAPGRRISGHRQEIVRGLLHGGHGQIRRFKPGHGCSVGRLERRSNALEQAACVVAHGLGAVDGALERCKGLAEFGLAEVVRQGLHGREQDRFRIAEQAPSS